MYMHNILHIAACPKHSTLQLYLAMYQYWCFHVGSKMVLIFNTYANLKSETTAPSNIDTMQKKMFKKCLKFSCLMWQL